MQHFVNQGYDGCTTFLGIAAALEDAGVARFQAECKAVEAYVGSRFEDNADDAKGNTDACQFKTIGQHRVLQRTPEWRG